MLNHKKTTQFRHAIQREALLVAPGAYDVLTAKIIERLGFEAIFFSGGSVAVSLLGFPDIGLISFNEMLNHLRNMVQAVDIPVFADGDNGYGNALNVQRTVREYETAGVVGIQLDDLVLPKRYAEPNKQLLPIEEVKGKIRAAQDAKTQEDFVIIFRTLARLDHTLEEAISRANAAVESGADVVFVDNLRSEEEFKTLIKEVDAPLLINMNEKSVAADFSTSTMESLGFSLAIFPVSSISAAAHGALTVLTELKNTGSTINVRQHMTPMTELYNLANFDEYKALEKQYLPSGEAMS
ncbi:carboxyvinyl-carboxyphosphonate phosphorylmutase [candidate division KSB3 bacterium]|uniref:Carboxyvinyl-carboxyphosphonate phosphorylmutase n=1 Tax=candidate division KSB3 bacterium TaxID=2044937 RepID=A0A2G6KEH4_9BACT|nr:MAG: carboxyvinyl-carboxyphosphonate phosphorylmutase [candidate division KSB3 bacterium]